MPDQIDTRGRVLVVDDDYLMRLAVEGVLSVDFEVKTASNVTEALSALADAEFDVVVTDYEMPGGSGLDLMRSVETKFPNVMVIMLTGHVEVADVRQAESVQGLIRVLSKPYDPPRLIRWVANTVKLAQMRRATNQLTSSNRLPRHGVVLKVTYPHETAEDLLTDLNLRGAFVRTDRDLMIGQGLNFYISFPGMPEPIPLEAIVRRRINGSTGRGVGVTFRNLSSGTLRQLERLLSCWSSNPNTLLGPLRLAILETEPALRAAYEKHLSALGSDGSKHGRLDLVWASNTSTFLGQVSEQHTHLAIANADGLDGTVAKWVSRLRAAPGCDRLPLVLLCETAQALPAPDALAMYVQKPVAIENIVRTLGTLLSCGLVR